jgi:hypothetical protein
MSLDLKAISSKIVQGPDANEPEAEASGGDVSEAGQEAAASDVLSALDSKDPKALVSALKDLLELLKE